MTSQVAITGPNNEQLMSLLQVEMQEFNGIAPYLGKYVYLLELDENSDTNIMCGGAAFTQHSSLA